MVKQKGSSLGDQVRRAREAAGLIQVEAARRAGMSQSQWSQIETGDRRNLRLETLRQMARVLGVPLRDLLD